MAKKDLDWSNLPFGYMKTDKRFVSYFKDLFKNPVDQVFFLSILLIILI